jgi:short subunit dehydrogenase-like uncharacterized protein
LAQIKPAREMLRKLLPSGEGPSAEDRAKSRFRVTFLGKAGETRVTTEVRGGDPGYSETAKMVAEAALALAKDRAELPPYVGVLSPAAAMGDVLLTRLQNAGIVFEVVSTPNGSAHP